MASPGRTARRRELAAQLRARVAARVGGATGTFEDEDFLRRVIAEKHRDS